MMNDYQYHTVRVSCTVHQLNLMVKFPCSISLTLKADGKVSDGLKTYQLVNGKCEPNEKLTLDVDVIMEGENYGEAKVALAILMNNNKISAGSMLIKLVSEGKLRSFQETELGVDKCPDKSASAIVSLKTEYVRTVHKPISHYASSDKLSNPASLYRLGTPHHRQRRSNLYPNHESKFPSKLQIKSKGFDQQRVNPFEDGEEQISSVTQSRNREKEKFHYAKEISKLKEQIFMLRKDEHWNVEEQLYKYKNQIENILQELDGYKQKNRILQRKDRENGNIIKDLKQQLEKIKIKLNQNQFQKNYSLQILEQKDKIIKQLENELKIFKEQLDTTKINMGMNEKKMGIRDSANQEQLKKMNEKYKQSQNQRQKAISELNKVLEDMQRNEKKGQLQLKEKEKQHLQQKAVFMKKNEQIIRQLDKINDQKEIFTIQNNQLQKTYQSLNKKYQETENQLRDSNIMNQKLKTDLQKKNLLLKNLEKQLEENKTQSQTFANIKVKLKELQTQNSQSLQYLEKERKQNQMLKNKIKDTEKLYNDVSDEKVTLFNELNESKDKYTKFLVSHESRERQVFNLNQTINDLIKKNSQLKTKSNNEKQIYEEGLANAQQEISYYAKKAQYAENQVEQIKWNIERLEEECSNLRNNLNLKKQANLQLNQLIINSDERIKRLQDEKKQVENQKQILKTEKQYYQKRQKELAETLKQKVNMIFNLNKQIKEKEQQSYLLAEKIQENKLSLSNKTAELQNKFAEQCTEIKDKEKMIIQLNQNLDGIESQVKRLNQILLFKEEQLDCHKQTIKSLQKELNQNEKILNEAKNQTQELNDTLKIRENQIDQQKTKTKSLSDNDQRTKKEWEQYRQNTFHALSNFFEILSKDYDVNQKKQLLQFPDTQLSNLQIQSLRKRKTIKLQYQDKIKQLEQSKLIVEMQLNKLKKNAEEREIQLEKNIENEKNRFRNQQQEYSTQKNEMIQKLMKVQENVLNLRGQNEKLSSQISKKEQISEQQQEQIEKLTSQCSNLVEKLSQVEKSKQNIKIQNEKEQTTKDSEYSMLMNERKTQIEQLRQTINQYQRKIMNFEKNILQKDSFLKKLESQLSSSNYSKQKIENQVVFLQTKLNQQNNNKITLEKEIKNYENIIKEKNHEIDNMKIENANLKFNIEDFTIKNRKSTEELNQQITANQKLKEEIDAAAESLVEADSMMKKIIQNNKEEINKLKAHNKCLQEEGIHLKSQIELKIFLINQFQSNIKELKESIHELQKQIIGKKSQLVGLNENLLEKTNQIFSIKQLLESEAKEKEDFTILLQKQKQKIQQFQLEIQSYQKKMEKYVKIERELSKLKEESTSRDDKAQSVQKQYKNMINDLKKEVGVKTAIEEEQKKKIESLQKLIEDMKYEWNMKEQVDDQLQQEKMQLLNEISEMEKENLTLRNEIIIVRETAEKQIDSINHECIDLTGTLSDKEEQIKQQNRIIQEYEEKIKSLSSELKNFVEVWNRQKLVVEKAEDKSSISKYQKLLDDIDQRSEKLRKKSEISEQSKSPTELSQ